MSKFQRFSRRKSHCGFGLMCFLFLGQPQTALGECEWTASWRNHGSNQEQKFQVTEEKGVRFGLQADFLCIVSPVSLLDEKSKEDNPIKHVDMNCRYAEGERGMATGLAGIESESAFEVVHFFLTDQLGETSHSITLKFVCQESASSKPEGEASTPSVPK